MIKWHEWDSAAFEQARREGKLILLDIHGVWCHWCHVMDKNTYSNDIVTELINEKFIAVKVDTDKRPDINERYNQGGWPTTCVLNPDGEIIDGATYLPADQMAMFLERASKHKHTEAVREKEPHKSEVKSISSDVADELVSMFDTEYGGFGFQPKFPFSDAVELLLMEYRKTKNKQWLEMALRTLDGLMGIFDDAEGGFYRYSVTRDWTVPHYEKMMETNAQLIENYLHVAAVTGDGKYRKIAERTADYIINNLLGEGFYASQDAGPEEEYYGKIAEERAKMHKPFIDRSVYTNLNGLAISAFVKLGGKYRERAIEVIRSLSANDLMEHYKGCGFSLLADNVYFIRALLDAYEATADTDYIDKAKSIMDNTIEKFFDRGFNDRTGGGIGLLENANRNLACNSAAAVCLLRLAFYTEDDRYRKKAEETLSYLTPHHGPHAASYALAAEVFIDGIDITVKEPMQLPYDPRIAVKYDSSADKILVCRGMKCTALNSAVELEKSL